MADIKKGGGSAVYVLGLIGAIVFQVQQNVGLEDTVIGILKAFVWPAFLVHKLLGL
jgi:hypothetical protein